MFQTTIVGYPRIGRQRELKRACESYWAGDIDEAALQRTAAELRHTHWVAQRDAGIALLPVGDFSLYDQVLDSIALIGAVPDRYQWRGGSVDLATYFAMARGVQRADLDAKAMAMTKWFDTNYHYIVPEWHQGQEFSLATTKPFDELAEAQALGMRAKPVLLGPLSLALLGKAQDERVDVLGETLAGIVAIYATVIERLAAAGAEWIQLDEPCLVQDRTAPELAALRQAYDTLAAHKGDARLAVQTYFGTVGPNYETLATLPVDALGLDLVRGPDQVELLRRHPLPDDKMLVAGVVDGRNVWRTDLGAALDTLDQVATLLGRERVAVSSSCSLLHVPYDVAREDGLPPEVRGWLAFAEQKLSEVATLGRALHEGREVVAEALRQSDEARDERRASPLIHDDAVRRSLAEARTLRRVPFAERRPLQQQQLRLPTLPTTTIGSFPQTPAVRRMRFRYEHGKLSAQEYEQFLERTIAETITFQESVGLDVLVHGEIERNDMVQYFGERLAGVATTQDGWVQSYGSRCTRPPIIYGDVSRPAPMTVRWSAYAQSLTEKPVKGMLTGPVTILNWSFVRQDQPREETCRQIALALRDEVADLERAGLRVIQIDEPAIREGLPLRTEARADYLTWAVDCFQLAASSAGPATQIHTHMCYSDFDDILGAIAALDADVFSIEHARSGGALLEELLGAGFDREIGPGVYDIHSPRVPSVDDITALLRATLRLVPADRVWVNPDCGLKTRTWDEVAPALEHLVAAAQQLRAASGLHASTATIDAGRGGSQA